ncbi:hypothetical protein [Streptomyces phytophilus]|uniref:hypothetical protein n=1 Tax=Streptomyces phytophilus TaxID=722715 RepID=UPI0015F0E0DB|nr:hypothetical protein [Streptomyces phytophilus]
MTTPPTNGTPVGSFEGFRPLLPLQPEPDPAQQAAIDHHARRIKELEARIDGLRKQREERPSPKPEPAPAVKPDRAEKFDKWSLRLALAATIGLTASGEYALAKLAGCSGSLAWLLPVAIDVYVVQTFRRHRDVLPALLLMIAANAIYHLADRTEFGMAAKDRPEWWLIVGVAAIAPVVMWRIHRIGRPREGAPKPSASAPVESTAPSVDESASEAPRVDESPRESAPTESPDASGESAPPSPPSESKPKPRRRARESKQTVSAIGDREREIDALVALMRKRGDADAVKLSDAQRLVASDSEATAARRLKAARETYRESA